MRIKKLLIVGALALATTGCVSAYTYAAAPNDSTESSIDTSKDSAKIKADSESTTEAKENADQQLQICNKCPYIAKCIIDHKTVRIRRRLS